MVDHVVAVHPYGTSTEVVGDTNGSVQVGGVNSSRKAVGSVVGSLDDLFFCAELGNGADRAEDLLLHDLHVWLNIGEDGGLDEISLLSVSLTTDLDLGTSLLALFNITHDTVILKLRDLWALKGITLEWVANLVLLCAGLESLHKFVVDAVLDIDTGSSAAALAVVEKDTKVNPSAVSRVISIE
jgi:hypothetical protein